MTNEKPNPPPGIDADADSNADASCCEHEACTPEAIAYAKEQRGMRCAKGHYTVVATGDDERNYVCCSCGQIGSFNTFLRLKRR